MMRVALATAWLVVAAFFCFFPAPVARAVDFFPREEIHFEVTATLVINGTPYSGTAVWGAHVKTQPAFAFETVIDAAMVGEAISITGPGGVKYFILPRPTSENRPTNIAGSSSLRYGAFIVNCADKDSDYRQYIQNILNFRGSCKVLARPTIVSFADLNEPSTAVRLNYGLGAPENGVEFLPIEVKWTELPLTYRIVDALPWISTMEVDADIFTGRPTSQYSNTFTTRSDRLYIFDFIRS